SLQRLFFSLLLFVFLFSFILCYKEQDGEDRHDLRAISSNVDLDETNPYEEDERLLRVLHHVGGFTGIRNTWKQ
ncbi:hypothetical protein PENTCL1PPCAC_17696, partial [Pristionchus entomophagus]